MVSKNWEYVDFGVCRGPWLLCLIIMVQLRNGAVTWLTTVCDSIRQCMADPQEEISVPTNSNPGRHKQRKWRGFGISRRGVSIHVSPDVCVLPTVEKASLGGVFITVIYQVPGTLKVADDFFFGYLVPGTWYLVPGRCLPWGVVAALQWKHV